jgi:hypothetical protein
LQVKQGVESETMWKLLEKVAPWRNTEPGATLSDSCAVAQITRSLAQDPRVDAQ